MSEESKNSLLVAGAITAVIMVLLIFFGNVGSGFFRMLMVFIVGTIIGTPLAIAGKFIGMWFAKLFMKEYETLYTYVGFLIGAILGGALAGVLFSNKVETAFVGYCGQSGNSKAVCECVYDKLDDKYDDLESIVFSNKLSSTTVQNFIIEATNECRKEQ